MIARKLLNSKKAGIPAINEIVLTFLNTTPKPILILIFILLITTMATFVVPVMLNAFGYECIEVDGELELYQIPMREITDVSSFLGRFDLEITQFRETNLGVTSYKLPDDPFKEGDKHFLAIPEECFVSATINGSDFVGYSALCMQCDTNKAYFPLNGIFTPLSKQICISDATEQRDLGSTWYKNAKFCNLCQPPTEYYYNFTYCVENDECYFLLNSSYEDRIDDIDSDWTSNVYLKKILALNGVKRTQDDSEFVNIQCSGVNNPQLYFFSIKVFDRQLWIFLVVGWALITFAMMWYNVVL